MSKEKAPLMSIRQAAAAGIERVRKPVWAHPCDHIKIDIFDGALGPWAHLYAPFNKVCNGRDPVDILIAPAGINSLHIDPDTVEFVAHEGPDSESKAYADAVARHTGTPSP